jgi:spore coat protein U-like protein
MPKLALTALLLLLGYTQPGAAQSCTFSIANLSFGTYISPLLNGVTPATVDCPFGQQYTIGLNAGTGAGATTTLRKMTGPGGAELNYQLFRDSARTLNWGNTSGVDIYSGMGIGFQQTIYVYGQVPAGQFVAPGTYTDRVSSATTSFTITAVVQATCSISASALAFGNYSGTLVNSTSTLSITCTNTTSYNVGLNAGTASGATVTNRSMTGPASALLGYKLFSNSKRSANWGNTVGTSTVAGTGSGAVQSLTVYGQLPAGEQVAPGTYSDTITATITY